MGLSSLGIVVFAAIVPAAVFASSSWVGAGESGAPNDRGTCASAGCHVGQEPGIRVEITAEGGNTYVPGQTKQITISIDDSAPVYGFQMTSRLVNDPLVQAGTFQPLDNRVGVWCSTPGLVSSPRGASGCPASAPLEYIGHNQRTTTSVFIFRWTPPASGAGEIIFYLAAVAGNNNNNATSDRVHIAQLRLAAPFPPTIGAGGIISAGNFGGRAIAAPQTWVEIYGNDLAPTTATWDAAVASGVAPTELNGVTVTIGGRPAPLSYVSQRQINAQIPDGIGPGQATVAIRTPAGATGGYVLQVADASPGVLAPPTFRAGGRQFVAALNADGSFVGQPNFLGPTIVTRSARPGDQVVLYAIGLGPTNPRQTAGTVVQDPNALGSFILRINNIPVQTTYAGLAPGAIGLYQINFIVPDVGTGEFPVTGSAVAGTTFQPNLFINLR